MEIGRSLTFAVAILLMLTFAVLSTVHYIIISAETATTISIQQAEGTIIDHDITTDTVWTSSGSPYKVISHITIHKNATLRIEPGTKVIFANGITITVEGAIITNGTETSRIIFELINPKSGTNYIRFKILNGAIELRYTTVNIPFLLLDGIPGIFVNLVTGRLVLDNSDVNNILLGWTTHRLWYMNLTMRDTIIRGSLGTVGAFGAVFPQIMAEGTTVNIVNSIVLGNIEIVSYEKQSVIKIENSVFMGYFSLYNNIIGNITNSTFIDSRIKIKVILCTREHGAVVLRNNMIVNSVVDLNPTACGYEPPDAVDARYNWWGDPTGPYNDRVNPKGKGSVIENINLGVTKLYPWLSEPPRKLPELTVSLYPRHAFIGIPMKISIEVPGEKNLKLVAVDITNLGRLILTNKTELTINIDKDYYYPLNLKVIVITRDLRANIFTTQFYAVAKPEITPTLQLLKAVYSSNKTIATSREVIINASVVVKFPITYSSYNITQTVASWLLNNTIIELEVSKEGRSLPGNLVKESVGANFRGLQYMYNLSDGVYNASIIAKTPIGRYNTSIAFYVDTSPPTVKQIEVVKIEEYGHQRYRVVLRVNVEDQMGVYAEIYVDGRYEGLKSIKRDLNELETQLVGAGQHNVTIVFMDELRHRTDPYVFTISTDMISQTWPFTATITQLLTTPMSVLILAIIVGVIPMTIVLLKRRKV